MLFIKCPKTGKPVPTRMDMPIGMDLSGLSNNSVSCPHCGEMHKWDGKDAFHQK